MACSPEHPNSVNKIHPEPLSQLQVTVAPICSLFPSSAENLPAKDLIKIATWLATKKFTCQVNKIRLATAQHATRQSQHALSVPSSVCIPVLYLMCLSSDPGSDFLPVLLILKVAQPPWGSISPRLSAVHTKFYNFLGSSQSFRSALWYP